MVEFLVGGAIFGIIGFGLGRLRLNALKRQLVSRKGELVDQSVPVSGNEATLAVWSATYTQSVESLRDLLKCYFTAATIGVAATATIIARTSTKPFILYASICLFLAAIMAAIVPLGKVATVLSNDASKIAHKTISTTARRIRLPQSFKRNSFPISLTWSVVLLGAAITCLTYGVFALPTCEDTPSYLSFLLHCL